jgi:hypothetical protein
MSKRSHSDYLLSSSDAEHERLIRQATLLAPFTERFFRTLASPPVKACWIWDREWAT